MESKKIKIAVIGGISHLSQAIKDMNAEIVEFRHEIVNLHKNRDDQSCEHYGKGKGDRIRKRQQWNKR